MQEWINSVLSSGNSDAAVLVAVFLLGVLSLFSCACNYAIIGALVGYTSTISSSGKTKSIVLSSVFFLLGLIISMTILGSIFGFAGELLNATTGKYWNIISGIISIIFGLYTLDLFPVKLPFFKLNYKNTNSSFSGAILFGLFTGGIASLGSICCSPFFPIIMAASFVKGSTVWGIFMLVVYAFGFGIAATAAMIFVGIGLGKISEKTSKLSAVLKYAGGSILIIVGFYFLLS